MKKLDAQTAAKSARGTLDEAIEQYLAKYTNPDLDHVHALLADAVKFGANWREANPLTAQYTDQDMQNLINHVAKYDWGHRDPISAIKEWLQDFKQPTK